MTAEREVFPQELEQKIEAYALQFLSQGRIGWDEPHTRSVVHYAGEIASQEGFDVLVFRTVGWLHDIGYFAMFDGASSDSYDDVKDKKAAHMINGARLAQEFLNREDISPFYTDDQKDKIIHLVSVHDKVRELITDEEIAFMEADTLGAIDLSRATPTFDKENGQKYIRGLMVKRAPRFKTETGKKYFNELLGPFMQYFEFES